MHNWMDGDINGTAWWRLAESGRCVVIYISSDLYQSSFYDTKRDSIYPQPFHMGIPPLGV